MPICSKNCKLQHLEEIGLINEQIKSKKNIDEQITKNIFILDTLNLTKLFCKKFSIHNPKYSLINFFNNNKKKIAN